MGWDDIGKTLEQRDMRLSASNFGRVSEPGSLIRSYYSHGISTKDRGLPGDLRRKNGLDPILFEISNCLETYYVLGVPV